MTKKTKKKDTMSERYLEGLVDFYCIQDWGGPRVYRKTLHALYCYDKGNEQ